MEGKKLVSTRANRELGIFTQYLCEEAYSGVVAYILLARRNSDGGNTCRKGQEKQHHDEETEDQEKRKVLEIQLDA